MRPWGYDIDLMVWSWHGLVVQDLVMESVPDVSAYRDTASATLQEANNHLSLSEQEDSAVLCSCAANVIVAGGYT